MTFTQQIFVVFYAIFWGTVANAQTKWKAFHWPLLFRCAPASWRLLLSFFFLSVMPIAFFAWALRYLANTGAVLGVKETLAGVVPAIAIFGFYRLWLGIAELRRNTFYRQNTSTCPAFPVEVEPTVESLHIDPKSGGWWNVLYGLVYLVTSIASLPVLSGEVLRSKELTCNGTVTYGQQTFSDQIMLRFSNYDVEVKGKAGATSTFEGMQPYKICSESENEVDFEYTTSLKCGSNVTRGGRLHKIFGSLRLTRSDRGEPFVGNYSCKSAQRVLN